MEALWCTYLFGRDGRNFILDGLHVYSMRSTARMGTVCVVTHSSERCGHPDTGESQYEDGEAGEVAQEFHRRGR